jgi:hypothetical protein
MSAAIQDWANAGLVIDFLGGALFLVVYTLRAKRWWWNYPEGRAIGLLFCALTAGAIPSIVDNLFGVERARSSVISLFQTSMFFVAAVFIGGSIWTMWHDL